MRKSTNGTYNQSYLRLSSKVDPVTTRGSAGVIVLAIIIHDRTIMVTFVAKKTRVASAQSLLLNIYLIII